MQNFFPHIDVEYYVFLDLTKNSKSDVDERGHRIRFFQTRQRGCVRGMSGVCHPLRIQFPAVNQRRDETKHPPRSSNRELTILGRERRPRLHKTKTAITEIEAVQLCRKHNLKNLLSE